MSTPSAPADTPKTVLGTGAYGDPVKPEQTREEYAAEHPDAPKPANPSSEPILVSGPEGAVADPNAALPQSDTINVQAPSTPSGTAAGAPVTPDQAAATS